MEPKTPQFSAYDILGYLVPGAISLLLVDYSIMHHFYSMQIDYAKILERYSTLKLSAAIPLILLSYFVGHMISFASSMTVERHAKWLYGEPMKILLSHHSWKQYSYFQTGGKNQRFSRVLRFLTIAAVSPIFILEFIFYITRITKNYVKPMAEDIRQATLRALSILSERYQIKQDNEDYFSREFELLAINYTTENAPSHLYSLRNYLVLYGFLRSMTFVLVLCSWLYVIHVFCVEYKSSNCIANAVIVALMHMFLTSFLCCLSYGAFVKFWLRYYRDALLGMTTVLLQKEYEKTI
jgi:hypothetical protein